MARLLGAAPGETATLRERIEAGETVLAPGCCDALGARLVEEAGFPAAYMTGFGSSASRLGWPDIGLMSLPEMVDNARRIVQAVDIPVIADADTGYGNPINVIRTVREYETAGVAAIHLEDQVMPKKCGHLEGKEIVPAREMVAKVEAAVARAFPDVPLLFNYAEGGKTPAVGYDRLRSLGFSIVIFPLTLLIGLPEMRELELRFAEE
jgi:2-methylisocitrate lyase-like PEP mutase family enzyme